MSYESDTIFNITLSNKQSNIRAGQILSGAEREACAEKSNGKTLGLCVVPKESHDCTLVK